MGISRTVLINTCDELFTEPLRYFGYFLRANPPKIGDEFWFEKPALSDQDKHKIIELQPSGFSEDELIDVAVNLIKGKAILEPDQPGGKDVIVDFVGEYLVRLSPRIWDKKSTTMDFWWHINTIDEARIACLDILDKVIHFGIPFLEDNSKTLKDWLPPES